MRNALMNTLIFVTIIACFCEGRSTPKDKRKKKLKTNRKLSGKCKPHIMAEYEMSFQGLWSESTYPRMYPKYRPPAQWSKLIGRSHSDRYSMWSEGKVASEAVHKFAEESDTRGFDTEAQAFGGIRDTFSAAPIRGGLGKTVTNFITDGRHTKMSFMVRLIPSPDWFVGVASLDLCERKRWKSQLEIDLYPMDAGTDRGLTFTAPNWPSIPKEKIHKLSPTIPNHTASAFYYKNMTSLPPIAKMYLTKISEYRRKGKKLPPLKQERNLIIYEDKTVKDMIPTLEKLIDKVTDQSLNEISPPRAQALTASSPVSLECEVTEWSEWTPCSKTCGFGHQVRRRTIVRRAIYCPVLREDRTCGTMRTCKYETFQFLKQTG